MSLNPFLLFHVCSLHAGLCHRHPTRGTLQEWVPALSGVCHRHSFHSGSSSTPSSSAPAQSKLHSSSLSPSSKKHQSSRAFNILPHANQYTTLIVFHNVHYCGISDPADRLTYGARLLIQETFTRRPLCARHWTRPKDRAMNDADPASRRVLIFLRFAHAMCPVRNTLSSNSRKPTLNPLKSLRKTSSLHKTFPHRWAYDHGCPTGFPQRLRGIFYLVSYTLETKLLFSVKLEAPKTRTPFKRLFGLSHP